MNYFNNNKDNYKKAARIMSLILGGLFLMAWDSFGSTYLMLSKDSVASDTVIVDFDQGNFSAGDIVSQIDYPAGSISVSGFNPAFEGQNAAMIFDTSNPTGGDFDLGTPNEMFGGPGMNLEGGDASSNDTPLNNVLIVSEDLNSEEPDDATADDISLTLDFSSPVTLISLDMLDLDSGEAGIILYDSAGNELLSISVAETGCNGVTTVMLGVPNVARMRVVLNGSGAIDNLIFVSDDSGDEGENTNPVALDDKFSTDVDSTLNVDAPGVLGNDTDIDDDEISIVAFDTTTNSGGTVMINPDGGFEYTPPSGFEGDDSFSYIICDDRGGSDTASVEVAVIRGATVPVANDDAYSSQKDSVLMIDAPGVLANDTDPNGDAISVTGFDTSETIGSVEVNTDGSFTYTPLPDSVYNDTFTYTIGDGNGNSDTATVSINMKDPRGEEDPVNSPPIAVADTVMTDQDREVIVTDPADGVLANDSDPDGDAIAAQEVIMGMTDQGGSIVINADGTFSYTPPLGFVGVDTYEYTVCDDQEPQLCDSAIISFIVEEVPVEIFNAFSPNGDGRNDTWIIPGITRFPENEVQIFNRWGNLIFQITGYDNTAKVWKGESTEGIVFGDNQVPDGGYFYVITLGDGSKRLSGFVVIQR